MTTPASRSLVPLTRAPVPARPDEPFPARGRGREGRFAPAGFLAQWLYQEVIPPGLHIEPWREANEAYGKASLQSPAIRHRAGA